MEKRHHEAGIQRGGTDKEGLFDKQEATELASRSIEFPESHERIQALMDRRAEIDGEIQKLQAEREKVEEASTFDDFKRMGSIDEFIVAKEYEKEIINALFSAHKEADSDRINAGVKVNGLGIAYKLAKGRIGDKDFNKDTFDAVFSKVEDMLHRTIH